MADAHKPSPSFAEQVSFIYERAHQLAAERGDSPADILTDLAAWCADEPLEDRQVVAAASAMEREARELRSQPAVRDSLRTMQTQDIKARRGMDLGE